MTAYNCTGCVSYGTCTLKTDDESVPKNCPFLNSSDNICWNKGVIPIKEDGHYKSHFYCEACGGECNLKTNIIYMPHDCLYDAYEPSWTIVMEPKFYNTGREYSKRGQRIGYARYKEGVLFVDLDRNIEGYIPGCDMENWEVLKHYDNGNYKAYSGVEDRDYLERLKFLTQESNV